MTGDRSSLTRRLRLLGNQVMLLAGEIAHDGRATAAAREPAAIQVDSDLWLIAAEDLYRERRQRSEFFPDDLFGEPAWDMLLDLYIAEKKNERISVTSACLGGAVPCATGIRWLRMLEQLGLVEREHDRADGRRKFVRLSSMGYARMTAYIAAQRSDWLGDDVLKPAERPADRGANCQPARFAA